VIFSTSIETDSAIVFTVFAPIASSPQADQHLIAVICHFQDFSLVPQQRLTCAIGIGHAKHLHLCPHQRLGAGGLEAATLAHELGHERRGSDDLGFFHHHRHKHVTPIDDEVGGNAHRQFEGADHVLDHPVSQRQSEGTGLRKKGHILGRQASCAAHFL
jgi:hypothetical protein